MGYKLCVHKKHVVELSDIAEFGRMQCGVNAILYKLCVELNCEAYFSDIVDASESHMIEISWEDFNQIMDWLEHPNDEKLLADISEILESVNMSMDEFILSLKELSTQADPDNEYIYFEWV